MYIKATIGKPCLLEGVPKTGSDLLALLEDMCMLLLLVIQYSRRKERGRRTAKPETSERILAGNRAVYMAWTYSFSVRVVVGTALREATALGHT
jgi:hypothetical protein